MDFMSFCGLCSNTNQSSKLEKDGRITEGDKHIRMAFFQAANPYIRDKKEIKQSESITKRSYRNMKEKVRKKKRRLHPLQSWQE